MTMKCVTTCNREGFEKYGQAFRQGWKHVNADLVWYTEGFDLPETERITEVKNEGLDNLQSFKKRWAFYKPPYYLWDVVRFSNKVYAVHDALRDHQGLGLWIDADMIPFADVPSGYIESLIEPGDYIAMFRRKGLYSECGFWVVDCNHPQHKPFMDSLLILYEEGQFKQLREWHDSYLMDAVVKQMERDGLITVTNLSGAYGTDDHPMAKVELAKYFDHLKGPARKDLGVSPENEHRKSCDTNNS